MQPTTATNRDAAATVYMKDITDTVNDVCHVFSWDKLYRKVAHVHVHNHSNSNVNTCTCATLRQSLSHTVGYCFYGTLLLRPHSACPLQIRAHHHIDVHTDINKGYKLHLPEILTLTALAMDTVCM